MRWPVSYTTHISTLRDMKKILLILLGGLIPSIIYAQNTDSLVHAFLNKSHNNSKIIVQKEAGLIATDSAYSTLELLERNSDRIVKLPVKGRWGDLTLENGYFLLYETDNIKHSEFSEYVRLRVFDASTLHEVMEDGVEIRSYGIIANYIFSRALNGEEMDGGFIVRKLGSHNWLQYFDILKHQYYSAVELNSTHILLIINYSREITGNFYPPKYKYGVKLYSYDIITHSFTPLDSLPNFRSVGIPPTGDNLWNYSDDHVGFFLERVSRTRLDSTFYYEFNKGQLHLRSSIFGYFTTSFKIKNNIYSITQYKRIFRIKDLTTGSYVDFDTSQLQKQNHIYLYRIAYAQKISNDMIYLTPKTFIINGKPTKQIVLKINFAQKSVQVVTNAILWNKKILK